MAIKKEVVISASKWWFRNVYVKNMQHVDDYVSARNEWFKSQGICGVVKNGVRENIIPYKLNDVDIEFFCETEEEEIIFILKWQ